MVDAFGFYIGGKWVDSRGRKQPDTINPAAGDVLATFRRPRIPAGAGSRHTS
jgi:acyl-CoA reductase-like NAD-dependent aldehyde dehydrogenase